MSSLEICKSGWLEMSKKPFTDLASITSAELLRDIGSNMDNGLSEEEASIRLNAVGANVQTEKSQSNPLKIFLHQFQSSVVALLLIAAVASAFYHEFLQAAGILIAVLVNALTGFYMEYKADISLSGLKKLAGATARTIRSGQHCDLDVSQLVPGDIVILEAGCRVPADLRAIDSAALSVDQSPITGESVPVFKDQHKAEDAEELSNIIFQGSLICSGRAKAVVLKTGKSSSLGRLGTFIEETESGGTPLERQLEQLGQHLSILTIIICAVVVLIGLVQKQEMLLMIETGIALAVAAIPEGLPVLATLALAVGTERMVMHKAILRHLSAVETLGCTSIICTDKTGTLTENRMLATNICFNKRAINVTGGGYAPFGSFIEDGIDIDPDRDYCLRELLTAGTLCNDARLEEHDEKGWHVHGDPTEGALISLAEKAGIAQEIVLRRYPRIAELPFDLERKRMTTIHSESQGWARAYCKGSPGALIELCTSYLSQEGIKPIDEETRLNFISENQRLASQGLRVLAFARKEIQLSDVQKGLAARSSSNLVNIDTTQLPNQEEIEKDFVFLGLVGMKDPAKEGVREAISRCNEAGIRVIMLTGDQVGTATAIGEELGILNPNHKVPESVLSGKQLAEMTDEQAVAALKSASVVARVAPEMKLGIVKHLQSDGSIVAMTGDGVNDAPALKQANIGVAMGQTGTDLACAAAQMVICDDNFRTIVSAVEQGRTIYGNIRRSVCYLLTASLASVLVVALGITVDAGLTLSPLQLLWLNLIMHIFPGLAIVLQPGDPGVMSYPPRKPNEKIVSRRQQLRILMRSVVVSFVVIFGLTMNTTGLNSKIELTSLGLATISMALLMQSWAWLGSDENGNYNIRRMFIINRPMILNMLVAIGLLLAAIYLPGLKEVLGTCSLNFETMAYSFFLAGVAFVSTITVETALSFYKKGPHSNPDRI